MQRMADGCQETRFAHAKRLENAHKSAKLGETDHQSVLEES
jgi:hypothetical protein